MSNRKQATTKKQLDQQALSLLGRHVSQKKGRTLLVVTVLACAMPMLLGLRLWDQIPEIVATGLIGPGGKDDSMPRALVVFGVPGLLCLLDAICHAQLLLNQKRMTLPAMPVRFVGRWGFPLISILFASGMMLESADRPLSVPFYAILVLGLLLMMLGSHLWQCPRDARVALRFSFMERQSQQDWDAFHANVGILWMVAGLIVILGTEMAGGATLVAGAVIVLSLIFPLCYGPIRFRGA